MLLAQGLAEYGAMSSLAAAFQSGMTHAQAFVSDMGPKEYVLVAAVGILLLRLVSGRRD